nr:ubiquitin hydrolase [Tanacetum cinerariifolium]
MKYLMIIFCSTSCKNNTKSLNTKITDLSEKLSDSKTMLYHYKLGLSQVEARLVEFKNQKIKFCEKIRGLEFSVESKNNKIKRLKKELEELKKKKQGLDTKLTGFQSASKDLDNLLRSQRSDKNKEGLGYSVVPPPAQVYSPPKKDMSWTGLPDSSVFEIRKSTSSILSKPEIKFVKAIDSPTVSKTNKDETVRKPSVKYAEMYRKTSKSSNVRGNQRNWNNLKPQQLGKNFLMKNKACFNCGEFDHLSYDCGKWVEKGKSWSKNKYTRKSRSPKTLFHNTGRTPSVNRPNVNSARPKTTQDLMIILIQRVKRLERELKARTPPLKIHYVEVKGRSRMTSLANKAILSGADNRPPMLEKDMYDSWKSKMELQHGRMVLESLENGPLLWLIVEENGVTRPKKYSELSATKAIQANCDTGLVVLVFQKGDDPIDAINHMMSFLTVVVTSRYPPTNNQLRNLSNPHQQATINNERVTIQPIYGRQNSLTAGMSRKYTSGPSGTNSGNRGSLFATIVREKATSKIPLMENLSHYGSDNLVEDFETRFVPQTELSAEQAFWSQNSGNSKEPNLSTSTTIVEVPKELPKVSMENSSLKKLKFNLTSFDMVVKERTTATTITEGT